MGLEDFKHKKKFGQNFLRNNIIPKRIINAADIKKDSLVIEIGPGAGIMTKLLATNPNVKQVLAYEIDTSLEEILDINLMGLDNIDIIYDDFLNRDIKSDIKKYKYTNLYVVANLPYYITTPIITKIIEENIDLEKMVIMIHLNKEKFL